MTKFLNLKFDVRTQKNGALEEAFVLKISL